jgi:chemotaxis protein CheD
MSLVTVDISDLKVSASPEDVLITYALGSCIAVVLYDPTLRAGGMIHFMLPNSSIAPDKAAARPAMFADTGVPLLFEAMYKLGCKKPQLVVKVAGGGKLYDDHGQFDIGQRNYTILRKMLWKNNLLIKAEDVGGAKSRTVRLLLSSGQTLVKSQGMEAEL